MAPVVENPPANAGDPGSIPRLEDSLERESATCSVTLTWRISWTEEPGGLQPTGSQSVRHDWATEHTYMHAGTKLVIQPLTDEAPAFCFHCVFHLSSSEETDADTLSSQDMANLSIGSGDGILCEMSRTRPRALLHECLVAWFARFLTTHTYIYKADCPSTTSPANLMCTECYWSEKLHLSFCILIGNPLL